MSMRIELDKNNMNGTVYLSKTKKRLYGWVCDGSFKYLGGKFEWFRELKEPYKSKAEKRILNLFNAIKRNDNNNGDK